MQRMKFPDGTLTCPPKEVAECALHVDRRTNQGFGKKARRQTAMEMICAHPYSFPFSLLGRLEFPVTLQLGRVVNYSHPVKEKK